jgi:hypothetical protein
MQRVGTLEAENRQLREASETAVSEVQLVRSEVDQARRAPAADHWSDTIKLYGNYRYRYEEIDVGARDTRTRHRIRARAGLAAQLSSDLEVGMRIAAGSESPRSGNTTLGRGGTSKDLFLDAAYARWQPFDGGYLVAGKMDNTFYRTQGTGLLWDGDYTPEGIAFGWAGQSLFLNSAAIWLESDSNRSNETTYWGLQGGLKLQPANNLTLTAGAGYVDIPVRGESVFFGDPDDFFGNSFTCTDPVAGEGCVYLNNYEELELFADLTVAGLPLPVVFFVDYVQNLDADEFDSGWLAGAKLGKTAAAGSWQLAYQYEDVEADATFGLLRDSNVGGGGTDISGHKFTGKYAVAKQWTLGVTWYLNNESGENATGRGTDLDRIVFDSVFKY